LEKSWSAGNGKFSGVINSGDDDQIGNVNIGGSIFRRPRQILGRNLRRDPDTFAGGTASLGNVSVGGSVLGGFGERSGDIFNSGGPVGAVSVRGNIVGGMRHGQRRHRYLSQQVDHRRRLDRRWQR
jgi:hypothetical protein